MPENLCIIKCSTTINMFKITVNAIVEVWEVSVGEILSCIREVGNHHNPYAIAVPSLDFMKILE